MIKDARCGYEANHHGLGHAAVLQFVIALWFATSASRLEGADPCVICPGIKVCADEQSGVCTTLMCNGFFAGIDCSNCFADDAQPCGGCTDISWGLDGDTLGFNGEKYYPYGSSCPMYRVFPADPDKLKPGTLTVRAACRNVYYYKSVQVVEGDCGGGCAQPSSAGSVS